MIRYGKAYSENHFYKHENRQVENPDCNGRHYPLADRCDSQCRQLHFARGRRGRWRDTPRRRSGIIGGMPQTRQ